MMRVVKCAVIVALAITTALSCDVVAAEMEEGRELRTDLTKDQVVKEMKRFRDLDRAEHVLDVYVDELRELKREIALSTAMDDHEKLRRTISVDRRLSKVEAAIEERIKEAEEAETSQDIALEQSPPQQSPSSERQVPTGWRQSRSWQGGGLLPGGSWQASQYQESWGQTMRTGSSSVDRSTSQQSNGNMDQMPGFFENFGQNAFGPNGFNPSSLGQSSQSRMGSSNQMPPAFMRSGVSQGGGTMIGSRASSSSSRSSGSSIFRRSGGR